MPTISLAGGEAGRSALSHDAVAHFEVAFTSAVTHLTADAFRIDTGGLAVVSEVTLSGFTDTYALSVSLTPAALPACPAGYIASTVVSGIICTRVVDKQLAWDDASAHCGPFGMATVSDEPTLRAVSTLRTWDANSYWYVAGVKDKGCGIPACVAA